MKVCACSAGNPDSAKFCAECGRSLDAAAPARCPACGVENAPGARFCTGCGAAMTAGARPSPAAATIAFDPHMLLGPITTLQGARTMAWIGAAGAALLFINQLFRAGPVLQSGALILIIAYLLKLAIYGGSAFALYRGWTVGGLASLVLHAWGVMTGLMAFNAMVRANGGAPAQGAGQMLLAILLWVVVPAALVCGIRGAMAWNRFKRGELAPPTNP